MHYKCIINVKDDMRVLVTHAVYAAYRSDCALWYAYVIHILCIRVMTVFKVPLWQCFAHGFSAVVDAPCNVLIVSALQNGPFCGPKWAVSQRKMGRFGR